MRLIASILIMLLAMPAAWPQQAGNEDGQLVCPVIGEQLAKRIAARIKGGGRCTAFCRGCGCKGGPGYRDPVTNSCVGYADLIRKCGPPPHRGCTPECAPVAPACLGHVMGRAWLRSFAAEVGLGIEFVPGQSAPR